MESRTPSACPTFADEVSHTRLYYQLVDISIKATSELGSYVVDHAHQGPLALVRVHIWVGIFMGGKFVTAESTTKITKIITPRKSPAIQYVIAVCVRKT